jgi:hypothetical protein
MPYCSNIRIGRKIDRQSGQAFVYGLMLMAVLAPLTIGVTLLGLNTGMSYFYKQKLERVTAYAAQHLATLPGGLDDGSTASEVDKFLRRLKLVPPATYEVSFPRPRTVMVTLHDLRLIDNTNYLPLTISLSDTRSAAPFANCVGYLRLEYDEQNGAAPTGPPRGCENNQAFVPILDSSQIESRSDDKFMFDANEWPMTHLVYHGKYSQWPNYR